ncbi:MAG: DUF6602 domain-containing protein [Bacteroidota bacterium]|jgi:hypothetical protein
MSKIKEFSEEHGKEFLRRAFQLQQEVLTKQLEMAAKTITHDPTYGQVTEKHFIRILRQYLPNRYSIDSAIVIDSNGQTSQQIDVVIYDKQYTPTLLDQYDHKYVPIEAVYAVIEIKPAIDATRLKYAANKANSVRRLFRTSVGFRTSTGIGNNPLTYILAGIIAPRCEWREGFDESFKKIHNSLERNEQIDFGLALDTGYYDTFTEIESLLKPTGRPRTDDDPLIKIPLDFKVMPQDNCLMIFVFRLLRLLQFIGTVPAIDWNKYITVLSN